MPATIVSSPIEIANELERLGLTGKQVLEVVHAMAGARADTTENDPPGAAGWSAWRMGVRRCREVTIHDKRFPGWERDETGQMSSVINRRLGVRLLVANTDDGTAVEAEDRFPQNRSRKGAATDRIVQGNQLSLFEEFDPTSNVVAFPATSEFSRELTSWYICVYVSGDRIRAEISCPTEIDGGYFADFSRRIILLGDDGAGLDPRTGRKEHGGDVVEFDIPVARK